MESRVGAHLVLIEGGRILLVRWADIIDERADETFVPPSSDH